jgi:hypothetical protein
MIGLPTNASLSVEVQMKLIAVLIISVRLFVPSAGCVVQDQKQRDAQPRGEPSSAPGAGQKFLERIVGQWDVTKVIHLGAGEPIRTSGRCRQSMIQDGRFLQSEFVFQQDDRRSTGLGIIGFEPESGLFTSFWVDSRQTRMSPRRSREPFDGEKIVLYSLPLDPQAPPSRRSKTITYLEDDGRKLVHRQFALGSADGERLFMELIMTRSR